MPTCFLNVTYFPMVTVHTETEVRAVCFRPYCAVVTNVLLGIAGVLSLSSAPSFDGVLRNASDGTVEAYLKPPYQSNHASFLERLPNGDFVMAWFSGTSEGESGVAIVVSKLLKGTGQWTEARTVSKRDHYSNQNPVLFYDNETSTLYLFHTQQDAKKLGADVGGESSATIWELQSSNDGASWSPPRIMFKIPGSFDRNRIIMSLRDTWLYPVYYAGGSRKDTSYIKENTNHQVFDTWQEHYFSGSNHLVQPTVIRPVNSSRKLVAFFRDRRAQYIYRAVSMDDGIGWSGPTKTTLPNNNSGIQATTLQSGKIAIVYNPTHDIRNPLVISLSEDEGLTWKYTRALEISKSSSHVEFSYPTLIQSPEGRIHVSYTFNRQTVKYKIIPNEKWIMEKE